MQVSVDGEMVYDLPEWKQNVIQNDIEATLFDADMKRRVAWVLDHKFVQSFKRFQDEWIEKLRNDPAVTSIPTDPEKFVNLVIARRDYQDKETREAARVAAP